MSTPPPPPPLTLDGALARLNSKAEDKTQKGRSFERLVKFFLENDPVYKSEYQKVDLWQQWARENDWSTQDIGIDLVAENRYGERTAIQVKFYETTTISRSDTDSFLAASGTEEFKHRLFIATSDKWSIHAERILGKQDKSCSRIGLDILRSSNVIWEAFFDNRVKAKVEKRSPQPHQKEAIKCVLDGLKDAERGKMIMACGTGKTFTSLKIAEKMAKPNGNVLFLVPSLSLLSQSLCEWSRYADRSLRSFAVCSDTKVGREEEDIREHDLVIPPTTDAKRLAEKLEDRLGNDADNLNVVFSTYNSIDVVSDAQQKFNAPEFDLIICDEAHRTTGTEKITKANEVKSSYYVKVHDGSFLKASRRLYMTATPRIYSEGSKLKARDRDLAVISMNDEKDYGKELYHLGFAEAVELELLSDYKVLVLGIGEEQAMDFVNEDYTGDVNTEDVAKLIGCYKGLAKNFKNTDGTALEEAEKYPMRQAVAFANTINASKKAMEAFNTILPKIIDSDDDGKEQLVCNAGHVDGKMNAIQRSSALNWLRDGSQDNKGFCHILCNARCLSEGIDVPALDAVIFLNPRKSQIDVVQAVGRVMRKAKGKKYGYVILPIVVREGKDPEEVLNKNPKDFKVVWQVLQALRAHDEKFNSIVNRIDLNEKQDKIIVNIWDEKEPQRSNENGTNYVTGHLFPELRKLSDALFARIVANCGDRQYWEKWVQEVAVIAETNIKRINTLLAIDSNRNQDAKKRFESFLKALRNNLNPEVSRDNAVEMLAQHLITQPVFEALFEDYSFVSMNPVSRSMQAVVNILDKHGLKSETEKLEKFYDSVKVRVEGINNAEGKQKVMKELYGKFFSEAFKKQSKQLGIVYTPIQIVDFILQSANFALQKEFGRKLTDEDVHILDPFTGTGTFMARLLRENDPLITSEDLQRKYKHELHANEITLLAYYIAAVNIEEVYHYRSMQEYQPFDGIVLADTFQLDTFRHREDGSDISSEVFQENSQRAKHQQKKSIQVIIGNPPYSVGSNNPNDNIKSQSFSAIDQRIKATYQSDSKATYIKSLYDSYIRAIRWASDRIENEGIVAFVTNGGFIDSHAADGLRKCLLDEFTSVYCLNLRGNKRIFGERGKQEGENVFGQGSRTSVAIVLLIKTGGNDSGKLFYYEIDDNLKTNEKLNKVEELGHIGNVKWRNIKPNNEHDWINQRNPSFLAYQPMGVKKSKIDSEGIFSFYSMGVLTGRNSWVYDFSKDKLAQRVAGMIDCYNSRVEAISNISFSDDTELFPADRSRIKWSRDLKKKARQGKAGEFDQSYIRKAAFRPYVKKWLYFDRHFNELVCRVPAIFPTPEAENLAICVLGVGEKTDFSVLVTDTTPDLHLLSGCQCFPLYQYHTSGDMLSESATRVDNITNSTLASYRGKFADMEIIKEDIFYYIYGILHSSQYKQMYADDLSKMLPRIPIVGSNEDFKQFASAGRELAVLHLSYEKVSEYDLKENLNSIIEDDICGRVEKMKFAGTPRKPDRTKIIVNKFLTLSGIPIEAYNYKVNGKSPIEWVMNKCQIKAGDESGICHDPNDWDNDPRGIVSLLRKITYVSVESNKIIDNLPSLKLG